MTADVVAMVGSCGACAGAGVEWLGFGGGWAVAKNARIAMPPAKAACEMTTGL